MKEREPPQPAASRRMRAQPRYVLVGLAATLHRDGRSYPCTVRNISSAGLTAGLYEADLDHGPISIEFSTGDRAAGSILWARDWHLGLAFDTPVDVDTLLASVEGADAQLDRRADERRDVDCAARLRIDGRYYFGRLADISCSGARFCTSGRLKKLAASQLSVPDLPPLACMIRWASDGEFGLQFEERIPRDALDRWLAARGSPLAHHPDRG